VATGAHPLLRRLLHKVDATAETAPSLEAWQRMLALVARTFQDADQDRYTLERSIEISSREMQGLYQDLQERTQSELAVERRRVEDANAVLRATLESTTEGIIVVDRQRRVVAANRRYSEMFDVPEDMVASGDNLATTRRAARLRRDPEGALDDIEAIYASDAVFHGEIEMADGAIIDRYSAPVRLPDGQPVARVTFFRDVTAERAASAQIEAALEAAEAASQAKSMFLANMSHELRTPLNAVIGLADLLLLAGGDPVTTRQHEYLEGIVQSGRHLLAMVNDVLDLAKIEAGKHGIEREPIDVTSALEEAALVLAPLARGRGVTITTHVAEAIPTLSADPIRVRQILYNLLSNAIKFSDRGCSVRLVARREGAVVAIAVADTGIGISSTDLARLYRAFEQLALPSGDRPGGTGLGLALTKRLVEMHGGTIEVASELGAGTTFTVRLPVA
jgi:signal transduction histidine kinase